MYPDNSKLSGAFIHIFYSILFLLDLPKIPKKTPPPPKLSSINKGFHLFLTIAIIFILQDSSSKPTAGRKRKSEDRGGSSSMSWASKSSTVKQETKNDEITLKKSELDTLIISLKSLHDQLQILRNKI